MDPTFRRLALAYLRAAEAGHPRPEGDPQTYVCACGAVVEEGRAGHLLDALAEPLAEPDLKPRPVHLSGQYENHPPATRTDHEGAKVKVVGRTYTGPVDCPDCTRGLIGRGDDLICSQLGRDFAMKPCHAGCIIACGGERG